MRFVKNLFVGMSAAMLLASCGAGGDNQGTEYAPNMYHSVAYEPYSQIVDEDAGRWVTSIEYPDGHAEFFNSNKLNGKHRMNMRELPPNTVPRNKHGWLPYRLGKDSLAFAAATLKNPLDSTAAIVGEGKVLYETYCDHCHGPKGEGNGKVADKYAGVPNYKSDALKSISEGHIFHVITMGKGLMWSHASQISVEDRWKIAKYVKTLQK
ncbi:c-type cytochrome [Dawidia soli]|uniref:C-type cytochrome n=1 Tax=Dawidia soli TaxID=2782352 RepID=A0AAP2D6F4_9BACT|nr:cytochrome c [Dawidia soli]MBT1686229.1 c-type cytochrome [Dawidia soli]